MDCRRVVVKVPVGKPESLSYLSTERLCNTLKLVEIATCRLRSGVEDLVTVSINHQSENDS